MARGVGVLVSIVLIVFLAIALNKIRKRPVRTTWLPQYDFIIVGGGPAGSTLADRLSADASVSVLLLEAGVDDVTGGNLWMDIPILSPANLFSSSLYWTDMTEQQKHGGKSSRESRVPNVHGKLLGGSSSINMMIYVRGTPSDYNSWEEGGASQWSWEHVEPHFKRLENTHGIPQSEGMGDDGPMHVTLESPYHSIIDYIFNASREIGVKINENYNGASMLGSSLIQSMVRYGRRWSASSAFLNHSPQRGNLHVLTEAHVTKVLIENMTAAGVEFFKDGQMHTVRASGEVVLSAGTYNSPHLLLLSGIGPREELQKHQIEVVHDLPGVGQNLHDHPSVQQNIFVDDIPGISMAFADLTISNVLQYLIYGKGLFAQNSFPAHTFLRVNGTSWCGTDEVDDLSKAPDVQIMYSVSPMGGLSSLDQMKSVYDLLNVDAFTRNNYYNNTARPHGSSLVISGTKPKSRGSVTLASRDPFDRPIIHPNILSHPDDRNTLLQALRFVHSLVHSESLSSVEAYLIDEKFPDRERYCSEFLPYSDEYLQCYITYVSGTTFHGVGTCKMGTDPLSVVDPKLRVHSVKSLRVADASVMPQITSGNTQAPSMMIGARAAEFILDDLRKVRSSTP